MRERIDQFKQHLKEAALKSREDHDPNPVVYSHWDALRSFFEGDEQKSRIANNPATYPRWEALCTFFHEKIKSDLRLTEEFDALVFFAAYMQFIATKPSHLAQIPKQYREFLNEFQVATPYAIKNTELYYNEAIEMGLYLMGLNQDGKNRPFMMREQAPILRLASKKIFENYLQYKNDLHTQRGQHYKSQAEQQEKSRKAEELQSLLRWRTCTTILMLIPGIFFLTIGVGFTLAALSSGEYLGAAAIFFFSLLAAAFTPLAASLTYFYLSDDIQKLEKEIASANTKSAADVKLDKVVTKTLSHQEYETYKVKRKDTKNINNPLVMAYPSKVLAKPKKYVEKNGDKVTLYLIRSQAERFETYRQQQLNPGAKICDETFFKGLKASKLKSIEEADSVCMEMEKNSNLPHK